MVKLIGISGSLRQSSYNTALLKSAAQLLSANNSDATLDVQTIKGIPLYDGDLEAIEGTPASVNELKDRVAEADGIILATPEYNHSIPGAFKNAIDWLSRPQADIKKLFANKPIALVGATPGGFGTIQAQEAWLPILQYLGTRPWFSSTMLLSQAHNVFDKEGNLVDENVKAKLQQFISGFADFTKSNLR
jgi:chromate reductase